ncbi:CHASE2 domain-containing protein [bacterium]|nr:CHASE2 domain-containing protein [bacterium]
MNPYLRTIIHRLERDWQKLSPTVIRLGSSVAAAFVPIALLAGGYSEGMERELLRVWFPLRGARPVPQSVTIVRIDKPAYDKVGLSPGELFPREHLANAIERIAAGGAKLIIVDGIPQRPGNNPKNDERFAEVLRNTPTVIGRGTETVVDSDLSGKKRETSVQHQPIELFAKSAKAVIETEVPLTRGRVEQIALGNGTFVVSGENVPLLLPLRTFVRPDLVEPRGGDFINYYGPPSTLPSISLAQLVGDAPTAKSEYFWDRVVFIGAQSATGTGAEAGKDSFLTPVSNEWMFGVEIHATIAANLLDATWLRRLPLLQEGLLLSLVSFVVSLTVLSLRTSAGAGVAILAAGAWFTASYVAFSRMFYFLPAFVLLLVLIAVVVGRWAAVATLAGRSSKLAAPAKDQAPK